MSIYFVIFGAAVRADGQPSGTLRRRVEGALTAARGVAGARFLCTGGAGATGFIEAEVVREMLLSAGTPGEAILLEPQARDTLQSVRLCDALLRGRDDVEWVAPCTSRYHIPRCALLLRILGWRVRIVAMPGDRGQLPLSKLLWYWLKEMLALPYDVALLAIWRVARGG